MININCFELLQIYLWPKTVKGRDDLLTLQMINKNIHVDVKKWKATPGILPSTASQLYSSDS